MKRLLCAATALAFVVSAPAFAAVNDTTATANVTAKIIRPISVTKNVDLAFGTIVRPSAGTSNVKVDTSNTRSITGGDAVALASTTPTAAQFTIYGEGQQQITVEVPATFLLSNQTVASPDITVTTLNNLPGGTAVQTLGGALGSQSPDLVVKVGGSFDVGPTTSTGDYTGSFNVRAYYN